MFHSIQDVFSNHSFSCLCHSVVGHAAYSAKLNQINPNMQNLLRNLARRLGGVKLQHVCFMIRDMNYGTCYYYNLTSYNKARAFITYLLQTMTSKKPNSCTAFAGRWLFECFSKSNKRGINSHHHMINQCMLM